jgi:hypothetical protein
VGRVVTRTRTSCAPEQPGKPRRNPTQPAAGLAVAARKRGETGALTGQTQAPLASRDASPSKLEEGEAPPPPPKRGRGRPRKTPLTTVESPHQPEPSAASGEVEEGGYRSVVVLVEDSGHSMDVRDGKEAVGPAGGKPGFETNPGEGQVNGADCAKARVMGQNSEGGHVESDAEAASTHDAGEKAEEGPLAPVGDDTHAANSADSGEMSEEGPSVHASPAAEAVRTSGTEAVSTVNAREKAEEGPLAPVGNYSPAANSPDLGHNVVCSPSALASAEAHAGSFTEMEPMPVQGVLSLPTGRDTRADGSSDCGRALECERLAFAGAGVGPGAEKESSPSEGCGAPVGAVAQTHLPPSENCNSLSALGTVVAVGVGPLPCPQGGYVPHALPSEKDNAGTSAPLIHTGTGAAHGERGGAAPDVPRVLSGTDTAQPEENSAETKASLLRGGQDAPQEDATGAETHTPLMQSGTCTAQADRSSTGTHAPPGQKEVAETRVAPRASKRPAPTLLELIIKGCPKPRSAGQATKVAAPGVVQSSGFGEKGILAEAGEAFGKGHVEGSTEKPCGSASAAVRNSGNSPVQAFQWGGMKGQHPPPLPNKSLPVPMDADAENEKGVALTGGTALRGVVPLTSEHESGATHSGIPVSADTSPGQKTTGRMPAAATAGASSDGTHKIQTGDAVSGERNRGNAAGCQGALPSSKKGSVGGGEGNDMQAQEKGHEDGRETMAASAGVEVSGADPAEGGTLSGEGDGQGKEGPGVSLGAGESAAAAVEGGDSPGEGEAPTGEWNATTWMDWATGGTARGASKNPQTKGSDKSRNVGVEGGVNKRRGARRGA